MSQCGNVAMKYDVEINQRAGGKISKKRVDKIVEQTLRAVGVKKAEISIAFVGDAEMKRLNKEWRGKNCVTDVLSFDYRSRKTPIEKTPKNAEIFGEIIISYPQAARQAGEGGHSVGEEIKMLLVHGLLHLVGYDHEKSLKEAKEMEGLQHKIIKLLSI
jgi:rRNA maturation RNase YbeY